MRKKVLSFLFFTWTLSMGLTAFALPAFAVSVSENTGVALPGDSCSWALALAIGFLLIGSVVVLIVVHKKRNK